MPMHGYESIGLMCLCIDRNVIFDFRYIFYRYNRTRHIGCLVRFFGMHTQKQGICRINATFLRRENVQNRIRK